MQFLRSARWLSCSRVSGRRFALAGAIAGLAVLTMLALAAGLGPERLIAGDGHYVFAAARSLAFDGDLDLGNQYLVIGDRWGLGRDPTSDGWRLPSREIGPSLIMVPGLWLHWLVRARASFEPAFACLGAAASLGLAWLGCVRCIEAAGLGLRSAQVEWLAGFAVFGFVVPYYAIGSSGYPHAIDAAIGAWLTAALLERRAPAVVGVLLACAVLTRLQNGLWLLWPIVELALASKQANERSDSVRRCLVIGAIGLLGLAPQVWLGLAHPGSERGAWGWTSAFFNLDALASDLGRVLIGAHGLVRWTPIVALAGFGLFTGPRKSQNGRLPYPALVVIAALWLLFASVRDVDGGDAFGARRWAGTVGLWALGLARLTARIDPVRPRTLTATLALLVIGNLALTGLAIAGRVSLASPEPVRGPR